MKAYLSRITRYALNNFFRNTFISLSTVFITTTALFVLALSLVGNILVKDLIQTIEDRVDITVYFTIPTSEDIILEYKTFVEGLESVSEVDYISREEALVEYRKRHATDTALIEGLEELGTNPLRARLHVSSEEPEFYESIAESINSKDLYSESETRVIDKINFFENQAVINRLTAFTRSAEFIALVVIGILILASFIISFMTIRITIYTNREELKLMKLVGAGRSYANGPYIVEGILYGLISGVLASLLLYPFFVWAGRLTEDFLGGINIISYYVENIFWILGVLVAVGIIISVLSALLSLMKHLK